MIRIVVQSISDLITNSSSEIFALKADSSFKNVKSIIKEVAKKNEDSGEDQCSGEGGLLEFYTWEYMFQQWKECYIASNKQDLATPEMWSLTYNESLDTLKKTVWVDIDHSFKGTIDFILENFYVYYADGGLFERDPKTGRILRSVNCDEYRELPEERQYGYY